MYKKRQKHRGNIWQIQEAKAKFSQVIADAGSKGYQTVTKNGEPVAVIISMKEFDHLQHPSLSLLEFFQNAPYPEIELDITRSQEMPRDIDL